ncbi:MAG: hypothetical protein ACK4E5_03650 [Erythrobacter cryptus]
MSDPDFDVNVRNVGDERVVEVTANGWTVKLSVELTVVADSKAGQSFYVLNDQFLIDAAKNEIMQRVEHG